MADIPENSSTNTILTVGGTVNSSIDTNGDRDWVRIDLAAGEWVEVNQVGGTLDDPYMRLYDADGNLLDLDDDISASNLNSSLTFGGGEGGTYYVEAGSFNDTGTGTYTLSASAAAEPAGSPIDVLDSGITRTDSDNIVTVYFVPDGDQANFANLTSNPDADVTSEGWTQDEIDRVMIALGSIEAVADIDFQFSTNPNADFQMVLDDNELGNDNLLGYFFFPNGSGQSMGVFNANSSGWNAAGLQEGGQGYATVVHEALHGLGLEHPHADQAGDTAFVGSDTAFGDYGINGLNQGVYSIMSYNTGWSGGPNQPSSNGDAAGPMALDIAALQDMYGANTNYNNGTTMYELDGSNGAGTAWLSIWDTGGEDTIRYTGSRDTVIDLRAATLDYTPGGGGYISNASGIQGGFTIANGVIIENAIGGSGNDSLIGNDANNELTGNNGNDLLLGGSGDDDLDGGNNNDILMGGSGEDVILGGSGNDTATGGSGNDTIDSGANDDTVDGNSGNDEITTVSGTNTIYGSSGFDNITGGSGVDTIFGGNGNDIINGNGGNDFLFGGRGNDTINGGAGIDRITGGMGADNLDGGSGADDFIFEFVSDSYAGVGNRDTITFFEVGIDDIDLSIIGAIDFDDDIALNENGGNTVVEIDANGDGNVDMEIFIVGVTGLDSGDFIL